MARENKKEFLHSTSRIIDRMVQLERDYERIREDAKRIILDANNAKEDVAKIRSSLEGLFNDFLKGGDKK